MATALGVLAAECAGSTATDAAPTTGARKARAGAGLGDAVGDKIGRVEAADE